MINSEMFMQLSRIVCEHISHMKRAKEKKCANQYYNGNITTLKKN